MKILVFDVETTGLPDYNLRARDPLQPHLVQFAGILLEDDREVDRHKAIVRPDGWVIPDEVAAIHGITTEIARARGVPEAGVVELFNTWMREADLLVAHNLTFDKFLMRIAARRYDVITDADADWWKNFPGFCTMKEATPLCRIPSENGRGYKWPKLAEVYRHAFGRKLDGAHDALVDVLACAEVFQWMRGQGMVRPLPARPSPPALAVPSLRDVLASAHP